MFLRLFSLKCYRCGLILKSNDMIMKCKMLIYHYDCFNCDICNKKFQPGDEYLIKSDMLICKEDSINNERITSTPAAPSSLTVNINNNNYYKLNSDDSTAFSPSVSSSSVESLNINNHQNNNMALYETSPSSVTYNSYSNIDHNSNDYNYQSIRGKV